MKSNTFTNPEAQTIFNDLVEAGYTPFIDKKQYASILGCSVSCIDVYIQKGSSLPNYKKIGNARNGKVLFSLRDTSEFLAAQTVQTA